MNKDILIVEDNKETSEMIKAALEEAGFGTYCADGVKSAGAYLERQAPRLIVLDLCLPDGNGLELCCRVRDDVRLAGTPVIALTGQDALPQKEKGFSAGVDQYLTKPIAMGELQMWVKALLRRVSMDRAGGAVIALGDLEIDVKAQLLKYKNVLVENLTRREFELLQALVKSSPGILSRKEIVSGVWHTVAVDNLVDTHMYNMRSKLPPGLAARIQAVPGKGFRYVDGG